MLFSFKVPKCWVPRTSARKCGSGFVKCFWRNWNKPNISLRIFSLLFSTVGGLGCCFAHFLSAFPFETPRAKASGTGIICFPKKSFFPYHIKKKKKKCFCGLLVNAMACVCVPNSHCHHQRAAYRVSLAHKIQIQEKNKSYRACNHSEDTQLLQLWWAREELE